ncbi:GNAT family N-acetyltransferase [Caldisalinibacter kiritimatiensis]|uniref:N-acetyltransferase domain-containing protein n=1 Tax=Caldisalinibacter kiritimatiensis TaxID=1304284 RepID=R1CR58_9FIRM|nr:GNAT family N-acetyltransferase [Caldisalinibacter kiritimatiensis]EOD01161.1 hypothetical protein L21TH_0766 [Caldisalinibacter kiritimatiensis]
MTIISRPYNKEKDYERVSDFLVKTYSDKNDFQNWHQPRWEYMHYHPYFYNEELQKIHDKIRIWEDDEKIVGVAHFEHTLGNCYIEIDKEYSDLQDEMVQYAEENLKGQSEGRSFLTFYVNEHNNQFKEILKSRGYKNAKEYNEYMSVFETEKEFPEITLPEGFKLQSLEDENNLNKLHRVLWRGFNHGDEPDDDLSGRRLMQSAPNYRKDLNIVVVAPDGNYVSYCGMWYDDKNKFAYVEPVATDPDYRKMGLGKAAVLEGVRRCKELGATKAYVATNKKFYLKIGFETIYTMEAWGKVF